MEKAHPSGSLTRHFMLWNTRSGLRETAAEVERELEKLRLRGKQVYTLDWDKPSRMLDDMRAGEDDVLVAVGGDGTVRTGAELAYRHGLRLAVVPIGTFNHFAKHFGVPRDVPHAFEVLIEHTAVRIDIASVNEHVFVNFASVGMYAHIIHSRVARERVGLGKWPSFVLALAHGFRFHTRYLLRIRRNDAEVAVPTVLALVGNGALRIGGADLLAERLHVGAGVLQLSLLKSYRRARRLRTALALARAVLGRVGDMRGFSMHLLQRFEMDSVGKAEPPLVLDGELFELSYPLVFLSHPRALALLLPVSADT